MQEEKFEESETMGNLLVSQPCTECEVDDCDDPLAFAFQHSKTGVPITNRTFRLTKYPNVFLGSDAVTWLQGRLEIDREKAVEEGQRLLEKQVFSHVSGKKNFFDGFYFYRLAKHDVYGRYSPVEVPHDQTFYLSVHGFKGCPFCKRAIDAAKALETEVGAEILIVEALEHESRVDYSSWLKKKKNDLSKSYPKVVYHSSSPIVYTTNSNRYIGGLDEMIIFLSALPQFSGTKTLHKYRVESPVSTFFKGIPTIARNIKSTLPF